MAQSKIVCAPVKFCQAGNKRIIYYRLETREIVLVGMPDIGYQAVDKSTLTICNPEKGYQTLRRPNSIVIIWLRQQRTGYQTGSLLLN